MQHASEWEIENRCVGVVKLRLWLRYDELAHTGFTHLLHSCLGRVKLCVLRPGFTTVLSFCPSSSVCPQPKYDLIGELVVPDVHIRTSVVRSLLKKQ